MNIISKAQISLSAYVYLRLSIVPFAQMANPQVENTLFRVHRFFLKRDSAYFRNKLPHPPSPGDVTKGSSDNNPLDLEDTLKVDFERLLWVFYNPYVSRSYASSL